MAIPSAYTPAQIAAYEEHISLPTRYRQSNKPPLDLAYLASLHIHQISTIPYENLSLHYSPTHTISLSPQILYDKIITAKRGRGGYCMEVGIFFSHVLRALGFKTYLTGVRGRNREDGVPVGRFFGWVHIASIVTLTGPFGEEKRYAVDVGFGGDGPCMPLPMDPSPDPPIMQNLGSQQVRLLLGNIDEQLEKRNKLWIYQYRNSIEQEWKAFWSFLPDVEFTEADFAVMNWYTSTYTGPENWQTKRVIIVSFLRDGEEIVGKRMLIDGVVKQNDGGKTRVVREYGSEGERVKMLKDDFGITLTDQEIVAIKDTKAELKR